MRPELPSRAAALLLLLALVALGACDDHPLSDLSSDAEFMSGQWRLTAEILEDSFDPGLVGSTWQEIFDLTVDQYDMANIARYAGPPYDQCSPRAPIAFLIDSRIELSFEGEFQHETLDCWYRYSRTLTGDYDEDGFEILDIRSWRPISGSACAEAGYPADYRAIRRSDGRCEDCFPCKAGGAAARAVPRWDLAPSRYHAVLHPLP